MTGYDRFERAWVAILLAFGVVLLWLLVRGGTAAGPCGEVGKIDRIKSSWVARCWYVGDGMADGAVIVETTTDKQRICIRCNLWKPS